MKRLAVPDYSDRVLLHEKVLKVDDFGTHRGGTLRRHARPVEAVDDRTDVRRQEDGDEGEPDTTKELAGN